MTAEPMPAVDTDVEVAIIGSGFSGMCMAIQLEKAKRRSYVIFEKAGELGGTWRENHYPGCACDVPSHLYSFSFAPNPGWSRMYAPQAEIREYLERCADQYGVRPRIRFGTEIVRAEFDERGAFWRVYTARGDSVTARYLVSGMGALSRPAYPKLLGLERFRGRTFHSAEWDHRYDLSKKRVAVVGTGASAIQFVPQIAPKVEKLHLFQRTAPWVLPRMDRAVTSFEKRLFKLLPAAQQLYRYWIYWIAELRAYAFTVNPKAMKLAAGLGRNHIRRQIKDEKLREAVTPHYTPGCKRILLADDYYPALDRPNVEVVTAGIAEVTEHGIVGTDGIERPVDAIIYGTGFRVTDLLAPVSVLGRGGVDLNDAWKDGIEAYLGTTIAGYPNLFILTGPNTGLGHNSMVFMIESQVHYILRCMRAVDQHRARCADVRPSAQAEFNRKLEPRLQRSVWASGCRSWYLDEHGKNSTLWPGFTFEFWLSTRSMRQADYEFDPAPVGAGAEASPEAAARVNGFSL